MKLSTKLLPVIPYAVLALALVAANMDFVRTCFVGAACLGNMAQIY